MADRQTIEDALKDPRILDALHGLLGLPVGGWPETASARSELRGELPPRDQREYTWQQLVEYAMYEHGADAEGCGHYKWRPAVLAAIDKAQGREGTDGSANR